jgi:thiosulfate sulfurtransferase
MQQIDPAAARALFDTASATFVDIRDPGSYQEAHIKGALHLTDDTVRDFLTKTPKERPIVVCCYHGNMSRDAAAWLNEQGFAGAQSLIGGFEHWRSAYPDAIER